MDDTPTKELETEDGLNWKEITDALERLGNLQDWFKQKNVSLTSAARATLLSAMNIHLMEVEGDYRKAMTLMTEFMHAAWGTICTQLHKSMSQMIETGKLQGEKVKDTDLTSIKLVLDNMDKLNPAPNCIKAEEIEKLLLSQQELNMAVAAVGEKYHPLSAVRAMLVMSQQFMLFDMGDILSARTAFEDQSRLLWEISVANAKGIIREAEVAREKARANLPPEEQPS